MKSTSTVGTDATVAHLEAEIAKLDERRDVLTAAVRALVGRSVRPVQAKRALKTSVKTAAPRKGMRKAKYGERQSVVLDAYTALTEPMELTAFVRQLSSSRRQRSSYRSAVHRQVGLGRMVLADGMVLPAHFGGEAQ